MQALAEQAFLALPARTPQLSHNGTQPTVCDT